MIIQSLLNKSIKKTSQSKIINWFEQTGEKHRFNENEILLSLHEKNGYIGFIASGGVDVRIHTNNLSSSVVQSVYEGELIGVHDESIAEYRYFTIMKTEVIVAPKELFNQFLLSDTEILQYMLLNSLAEIKQLHLSLNDSHINEYKLLENSDEGILVLDNKIVVNANQQFLKITETSFEEIISSDFSHLLMKFNAEKQDLIIRYFENSNNTWKKIKNLKIRIYTSNQHLKWVSINLTHLSENKVIISLKDITQQIVNEQKLNKLSMAVEYNTASIMITDNKGIIEYVNPKYEKVSGYKYDELIGKNVRIFKSSKSPITNSGKLWETINQGKIWRGKFFNSKANGEEYIEKAVIMPIYDNKRKISNFLSIKEDITAHELINEQHEMLLGSINYAKRIQKAILPSKQLFAKYIKAEYFLLYEPKDIVAGDFYWIHENREKNRVFFAAADCTGHGVPAALLTVICYTALNRAVEEFGIITPSLILDKVNELVSSQINNVDDGVLDGMDISLCCIDYSSKRIEWSGANNPLWIVRNKNLKIIKGDKQSIGGYVNLPFTNYVEQLFPNDLIYIFTDGYADQFDDTSSLKFMKRRFSELIMENHHLPMNEQQAVLLKKHREWKGKEPQTDDVCVIGVKM